MTLNKAELKCQIIRGAYIFKEWTIYVTTLTFSLLAIFRCHSPNSWATCHQYKRVNISSAATFCFLVPPLVEPALATLQHKFIQTNCSTISGETFSKILLAKVWTLSFIVKMICINSKVLILISMLLDLGFILLLFSAGEWMEGRHKCDWSSCREGCTKVTWIIKQDAVF